jgi:hypothetical protein
MDPISSKDRERARLVLRLYDAVEKLGDAMEQSYCVEECASIAAQYRASAAQVHERLAQMDSNDEDDRKFTASLERAITYIDGNVEDILSNCKTA